MKTRTGMLLTLVVLAAGCGGKGSKRFVAAATAPVTSGATTGAVTSGSGAPIGSGSAAPVTTSRLGGVPLARVVTPASPAGRDVRLEYTLLDADADPADVAVEYSIDAGATWSPARDAGALRGSQGTTGLATAPGPGAVHEFVWDAGADLGSNLRYFVRLRLAPADRDGPGAPDETQTFTVDATVLPVRCQALVVPFDPAGPDTLSGFDLNALGSPTAAGAPLATGGRGRQMSSLSALVSSPRGDLLFASHNESAAISVYRVGAGGALAPVAGSPFATRANPSDLAVHPGGRFLYAVTGAALEAFAIDPQTGALTALAGSPFAVGSSPRGVAVHPRGDALYTGHMFGADLGLRVHRIDPATGIPTFASALGLAQVGSRPGKHLRIDPQGLRLICSDLDRGLFVCRIDPVTRGLSLAPNTPLSLGGFLSGAVTTSTRGQFLYVSITGRGLLGYRVDATGALLPIPGTPLTNVGADTLYLEPDSADRFLFASSRADDSLRIYAIDPQSGVLTEVPGSPLANPNQGGRLGPVRPLP